MPVVATVVNGGSRTRRTWVIVRQTWAKVAYFRHGRVTERHCPIKGERDMHCVLHAGQPQFFCLASLSGERRVTSRRNKCIAICVTKIFLIWRHADALGKITTWQCAKALVLLLKMHRTGWTRKNDTFKELIVDFTVMMHSHTLPRVL